MVAFPAAPGHCQEWYTVVSSWQLQEPACCLLHRCVMYIPARLLPLIYSLNDSSCVVHVFVLFVSYSVALILSHIVMMDMCMQCVHILYIYSLTLSPQCHASLLVLNILIIAFAFLVWYAWVYLSGFAVSSLTALVNPHICCIAQEDRSLLFITTSRLGWYLLKQ